jgi:tetrahydromethanopterin S-methyltransferase subunit G
MFETAVQEKRTGILWGVVIGLVALAVLLGTGYVLVT